MIAPARRWSLRVRLSGIVAVGAIVVVTLASLALYRDLSREISDAITAELEVRLAGLDASPERSVHESTPVLSQVIDPSGSVRSPEGATRLLTRAELDRALGEDLLLDRPVEPIGPHARIATRRIGGRDPAVGVAAASTQPLERARNRLLVIVLVGGPLLAGAVTLAAWALAGAALRPVRRMAERAGSISLTAPGERLPQPAGDDEVATLGATLNQMLDRIEQTVAHERAFIDDASHELRTPLAVLRAELELALRDLEDGADVADAAAGVRSAIEETDRLVALSDDLLILARSDAGELRPERAVVDLRRMVDEVVGRLGNPRPVHVEVVGDAALVVGEARWLERIFVNLIENALRHAAGDVRIELRRDGHWCVATVSDDGPGFAPELLPDAAFERFSRRHGAHGRTGTGLGLAIVTTLVAAHGGSVRALNRGGARVEVRLPASEP